MSKTHKKFYNINRWEQRFFMNLSPVQKLAWEYVNDKSDNIGVWEPNLKVLTFHIGAELDVDNFFKAVNSDKDRLLKLPDGNWFIPDYVKFQYCQSNPLNPCNRAHRSYLKDMDSRGLLDWFIGNYPDVLKTAVRYKSELEPEDLDKIPKPFQSFLDTLIKGSNRGLKEFNESRIEKEQEKASDKEKEQATDNEQEPTPNSLVKATDKESINGNPTSNKDFNPNDEDYFGKASLEEAPF